MYEAIQGTSVSKDVIYDQLYHFNLSQVVALFEKSKMSPEARNFMYVMAIFLVRLQVYHPTNDRYIICHWPAGENSEKCHLTIGKGWLYTKSFNSSAQLP